MPSFSRYLLSTAVSSPIVPLRVFEPGFLLKAQPKSIHHPEIHPPGNSTWCLVRLGGCASSCCQKGAMVGLAGSYFSGEKPGERTWVE